MRSPSWRPARAHRLKDESVPWHAEKRTLLTVIAAVCSLAKIDLAEHGVQKKILGAAEVLGLNISAAKISQIVKEVREALEDRQSKRGKSFS